MTYTHKNTEPCATESKSFACLHGCHGVQSVFRGRSSSLLLPQIPIDHNIIIIAIEKRHRGEYAPPQMIVMMEMVVFLLVGNSASNLCCSYHFTVAVAVASIRPFSFGRVYVL